jgi:hypothetical protein
MKSFDTTGLQMTAIYEPQELVPESWKRFAAAILMAAVALVVFGLVVVALAQLLPHPGTMSHDAALNPLPLAHSTRT